ncbi:MAG: FAD-binding oxidoreductase [Pseudomonadota bacterium]
MSTPLLPDLNELKSHLPDLKLAADEETLTHYGRDWTRFAEPAPSGVVFPADTAEVVALVKMAAERGWALVPSGGRTGLSGGAVAARGELVVSLDRMNRIGELDPVDRLVPVGAGLVTEALQNFAREQGLLYPVDFASKGSSQIGGNIATNAGGVKVLRYGNTRQWVAGLTVVTGTGEVLELNRGLVKNATGVDLRHLMVGSEGVLGIITEALIQLAEPPPAQAVMVLGVPDMPTVMRLFDQARHSLELSAFEFFSDLALNHVLSHGGSAPMETRSPFYALLEFDCEGDDGEAQALTLFEQALEAGLCTDGVLSQSDSQAQALWGLRENISERIAPHTPYKNDISVRISRVPELLSRLDEVVNQRYPDFEVVWYGHIGDGNLHLNILKPAELAVDEFQAACEAVNGDVFAIVEDLGGSVSAEHGVGLLKQPYLHHSRSAAEIELLRGLKALFDPHGILNPGKML